MKIKSSAKGFTLIELLVVVLIIGILSAVALPGYRKAVEKSKVADALSTMSAVSKSEQGWYILKDRYSKDFADLDIDLTDINGDKAEDETYQSTNFTFTLQDNNIKAERNNGEYTMYKDYESDLIYCLPREHYVCQEFDNVNKRICVEDIKGVWHNTSSVCYTDNEERCLQEYGEKYWFPNETNPSKSICGYKDPPKNTTLREGMKCIGTGENSCKGIVLKDGAECKTSDGSFCYSPKIYNGSSCIGDNGTFNKCNGATIYAGGKCSITSGFAGCIGSTIYGICEGNRSGNRNCYKSIIKDGGVCIGRETVGCGKVTVESGGTCIAYHSNACNKGDAEGEYSTYAPGSFCQGEVSGGCGGLQNMQGTCVANAAGACSNNTYSGDGCCTGEHCPAGAPRCSA